MVCWIEKKGEGWKEKERERTVLKSLILCLQCFALRRFLHLARCWATPTSSTQLKKEEKYSTFLSSVALSNLHLTYHTDP